MATHECIQCGYEPVSDDAKACPKCGARVHGLPKVGTSIFTVVAWIAFMVFVAWFVLSK